MEEAADKPMKKTWKLSLCGLIAALAVAVLFCSSWFPFGMFSVPALAGLALIVIVIECGWKWAAVVYVAISLLSFLILSDVRVAIMFTCFFGYYPIMKSWMEQRKHRVAEWIGKLLILNAAVALVWVLANYVLRLDITFTLFGYWNNWLLIPLWLGANAVFVLYDLAVTKLIAGYIKRIHRWISSRFRSE